MKISKLSWLCFGLFSVFAASCEPPLDDGAEVMTGEELLLPGGTFSRTIPPAPAPIGRVDTWAPGYTFMPRGYQARSFYVVYAGKEGQPGVVEAAGFDVVASRTLFEVELSASRLGAFLQDVHDFISIHGLGSVGNGISGNITVKCCKVPGTHFQPYFWSIAHLTAEAYAAPY